MNDNKMQKDLVKNKRIDYNIIKSYDELLQDEYANTLDAIIDSQTDYPENSLIKSSRNSIINSSYSRFINSKKLPSREEEFEKEQMYNESPLDVAQKYVDRTQFPL